MSETTFDGTLIPETSFETLRSEDSLAKRVDAFGAEKPTTSEWPALPDKLLKFAASWSQMHFLADGL